MAATVGERLLAALNKINRHGTFCAIGSDKAANPGLSVEGVGTIGLPLSASTAREIKARCVQAPYGLGTRTLVDTKVRKVWSLEPDRFTIDNPEWATFLAEATQAVQRELGLEQHALESHLYNLLLYEAGGFFLPHRDGEKLDRMVATMVVVLPSSFAGGELVVRHEGEERIIDFASSDFNPFHTRFAAFYADCEHEIRPLKSGWRLCLVYNLTLAATKSKQSILAPPSKAFVAEAADVLKKWPADEPNAKLAMALEHQYTPDGLTWDALKGVDRVKALVLREAAQLADCRVYLAMLTLWESGIAEEYEPRSRRRSRRYSRSEPEEVQETDEFAGQYEMEEVLDSSLTVERWTDAAGAAADYGKMQLVDSEIVPSGALRKVKPQEQYEGYTGNEGMTLERWYRRAALVVWPNSRHFDVLCDCTGVVAALRSSITRWKHDGAAEAGRVACRRFAAKVLGRLSGIGCNDAEAGDLLSTLNELDDPELIRIYLRDVIRDQRITFPVAPLVQACETHGWTTWTKEFVGLFENVIRIVAGQEARVDRLLVERNLMLLRAFSEVRSSRSPAEAQRLQLCKVLSKLVCDSLEVIDRAEAIGSYWQQRKLDRFVILSTVVRTLLAVGRSEELRAFLDRSMEDTSNYRLDDHYKAIVELRPWFGANLKTNHATVSYWIAKCRRRLEALTKREPKPPTDLTRNAEIRCKCSDCERVAMFLGNPSEQVFHLKAVQDKRRHVEYQTNGSDVTAKTQRIGSPHTLVLTKNSSSYERSLKTFHEDRERLKIILAIESDLPK